MRVPSYIRMAQVLGMRDLSVVKSFEGSGRFSGIMINTAAAMVHAGMAQTIACIYGNDGRSTGARYGGEEGGGSETLIFDTPYGMTSPGAQVAMMWQRYQHDYGAPREALAHLAINNRSNAALNPSAVMRDPLTMEDYERARYICEPLKLFDYCLINDGAVCIIVTTAERARDLKKPPVYISAAAMAGDVSDQYAVDDFFYNPLQRMASEIYPAAGISPADLSFANLYDNFTPTILFTLEGMGLAPRGEAARWVTPERIARVGGEMPLNLSGGHTSESYMQGMGHLAECVRQLRGECGERQVANPHHALYTCAAPLCCATIFHN
jgi:acetyl-CoA acetyltransferase